MSPYKFISYIAILSLTCLSSSVLAQDDVYEPNDTFESLLPTGDGTEVKQKGATS